MKLKKFLNWRAWLRGMWVSVAQGSTGAMIGFLGIGAANLVGVPVQPIDWKQAIGVGISAAAFRLILYVNAHPLPEEEEEVPDQEPIIPSAL